MKKLILLTVALCLTLSAGKNSTPAPTINVSCDPCASGAPITFYGSGYPPSQDILLELVQPNGEVLTNMLFPAQGHNGGSFNYTFVGLSATGVWTANAYAFHYPSHETLEDSISFTIQ